MTPENMTVEQVIDGIRAADMEVGYHQSQIAKLERLRDEYIEYLRSLGMDVAIN